MRAIDVMTTDVRTVRPETSIRELASLLCEHGISGAPVVDEAGDLVGIVSEGDLLHRSELGTERRRVGWLHRPRGVRDLARDYLKSHARMVGDVMTRDVVTVSETTFIDEIADLLETHRIRRVPVTRDGKLVGIVSRANLLRALARSERVERGGEAADDFTIREALLVELRGQPWVHVWGADIMVRNRVVHLWFADDQPAEERRALRVAAENVAGVVRVEEHLVRVSAMPPL